MARHCGCPTITKGSDENEGKRIAGAGGLILNNRVNGVLAVTRALGDAYMKDLVTGHPYTTETVIQPDMDEFLILACDGVSKINCGFRNSGTRANVIAALGRLL
jgi:serine/threonine protein phosphatase PrpC